MKLDLQSLKPHKLGSRGVSHIIVPLLAVVVVALGGTYMLVASHADTAASRAAAANAPKTTTPAPAAKAPTSKKSYLVIDGKTGVYTTAIIKAVNVDTKTHKCGGSFNANDDVTTNLKLKGVTTLTCSAIGGTGSYQVSLGRKAANGKLAYQPAQAVDIDTGYCTYIFGAHETDIAKQGVKYPVKGSKCPTEQPQTTKENVAVVMTLASAKDNKSILGYVGVVQTPAEIAAGSDDTAISRVKCTGYVVVSYYQPGSSDVPTIVKHPLKYTVNARTNLGYCVAVLGKTTANSKTQAYTGTGDAIKNVKAGATYQVTAEYDGNNYFNKPANGTADITLKAAATTSTASNTDIGANQSSSVILGD